MTRNPVFMLGCLTCSSQLGLRSAMPFPRKITIRNVQAACHAVVLFVAVALMFFQGTTANAATRGGYVALGDSQASASGVLPLDISRVPFDCAQSVRDYPHLVQGKMGFESFSDVTCGGAMVGNMLVEQVTPVSHTRVQPQFNALRPDTRLVTIGVGANDSGWSDVVLPCLTLLPVGTSCKSLLVDENGVDRFLPVFKRIEDNLAKRIADIHARSPQARILVLGYMKFVDETGIGCWPQLPIALSDARIFDNLERDLNQAIENAARRGGGEYIDAYAASIGHDACKLPGIRWVEPIVVAQGFAPIHPTALGARNEASLILQKLSEKSISEDVSIDLGLVDVGGRLHFDNGLDTAGRVTTVDGSELTAELQINDRVSAAAAANIGQLVIANAQVLVDNKQVYTGLQATAGGLASGSVMAGLSSGKIDAATQMQIGQKVLAAANIDVTTQKISADTVLNLGKLAVANAQLQMEDKQLYTAVQVSAGDIASGNSVIKVGNTIDLSTQIYLGKTLLMDNRLSVVNPLGGIAATMASFQPPRLPAVNVTNPVVQAVQSVVAKPVATVQAALQSAVQSVAIAQASMQSVLQSVAKPAIVVQAAVQSVARPVAVAQSIVQSAVQSAARPVIATAQAAVRFVAQAVKPVVAAAQSVVQAVSQFHLW